MNLFYDHRDVTET